MNAVYALFTGGLAVVSSVLTLVLNQHHTRQLRRLDHEHDHREPLQDQRLTAYREFDIAFTHQRRAYDRLADSRVARQLRDEGPNGTTPGPEGRSSKGAAVRAALQTTEDLQDALESVQLVATSAVYQQAASLMAAAKNAWVIPSGTLPAPSDRVGSPAPASGLPARLWLINAATGVTGKDRRARRRCWPNRTG